MPRTAFIDHIGIGVPDLAAAKRYYDELMPILGLKGSGSRRPPGASSTSDQTALVARRCSSIRRSKTARTHVTAPACNTSRSWSRAVRSSGKRTTGLAPREPRSSTRLASSPSTGQHYATFWLDPHGIMLEAMSPHPEESD